MKRPKVLIVCFTQTEAEHDYFCIDLQVLGYDSHLMLGASGINKALAAARYSAVIISKQIKTSPRKSDDGFALACRIKRERMSLPIIVLDSACTNAEDCMRDTGVRVIPSEVKHIEQVLAGLLYPERVRKAE